MFPMKDVLHSGQWWDPSHNHRPLKRRNKSWKPGRSKGAKAAPEFGEVAGGMSLPCAFGRWLVAHL